MVLSQNFPDYYDGIVAGDPVYDLEAIALSEAWSVEHIKAITPTPIRKLRNGLPILYQAFPVADQNLLQSAILAACDHLDGVVDGVVDNLAACHATFDPATFVFPNTGHPLQCVGAKTATCLTPAQIDAVKKINDGPRNSLGHRIKSAGRLAWSKIMPTIPCAVMPMMVVYDPIRHSFAEDRNPNFGPGGF